MAKEIDMPGCMKHKITSLEIFFLMLKDKVGMLVKLLERVLQRKSDNQFFKIGMNIHCAPGIPFAFGSFLLNIFSTEFC